MSFQNLCRRLGVLLVIAPLLSNGCHPSDSDSGALTPRTPAQAASQLEQAFASAPPDVKHNADLASRALREQEFEKAVVSLEAVRARDGVTLDQGLAIHSCVLTLEERLVNAMNAGDQNAKRAYDLLKRMKRN